jgi:predicted ATPase
MRIQELRLAGLLSFGPDTPPLPLEPLNLLVGPNGSGKSNLIEAISFLRSAATKLAAPIRGAGGGVGEWIWKGNPNGNAIVQAAFLELGRTSGLRHCLEFRAQAQSFSLLDETIDDTLAGSSNGARRYFYRYDNGQPKSFLRRDNRHTEIPSEVVSREESILSQLRDPDRYPEFSKLDDFYKQVRIYREWSFGRSSVFRSPQAADLPSDALEEDFSNLGLFLNHLRGHPSVKRTMLTELRSLYEGLDDFDVRIKGGTVEVFLTEGNFIIPASRLSDGTLRFLCLLAILCDPDPPPLICIEEPELGLHPDMLPRIAELMVTASQRTQLIVTTHSDILIDCMTERPECVIIFEKHKGCTVAKRLDAQKLGNWLAEYRLGQLWTKGQIGGVRW